MARKQVSPYARLLDLIISIGLVLLSVLLAVLLHLNFLTTTVLFFGLPSLYLIYRDPSHLKKATVAGLLFGVVWGFSFDYIAEFNHAWGWSTNTALALPIHLFGVVSLDIMVWYFLWVFMIVLFYEYFADRNSPKKISSNALWSALVGIIVMIGVVGLSKIDPNALHIPYPYFVLGILALIPFAYISYKRPKLWPRFIEIVPFFIFVYLAFELTALYLHLWGFAGQYIGVVQVMGVSFPFEEMLFWIIASSAVTASYFEYFIDDLK
jgi:hypothetical protein